MNIPNISNSHNPNDCFPPLLSFLADEPLYPGPGTSTTPEAVSINNGVMVMRGKRWPLMIDPQSQA